MNSSLEIPGAVGGHAPLETLIFGLLEASLGALHLTPFPHRFHVRSCFREDALKSRKTHCHELSLSFSDSTLRALQIAYVGCFQQLIFRRFSIKEMPSDVQRTEFKESLKAREASSTSATLNLSRFALKQRKRPSSTTKSIIFTDETWLNCSD